MKCQDENYCDILKVFHTIAMQVAYLNYMTYMCTEFKPE